MAKCGAPKKFPPDSFFDPQQLRWGIAAELEHTCDRDEAKRIAKTHLLESPRYYDYHRAMERRMKRGEAPNPQGERVSGPALILQAGSVSFPRPGGGETPYILFEYYGERMYWISDEAYALQSAVVNGHTVGQGAVVTIVQAYAYRGGNKNLLLDAVTLRRVVVEGPDGTRYGARRTLKRQGGGLAPNPRLAAEAARLLRKFEREAKR